jgi:hypothetical protein
VLWIEEALLLESYGMPRDSFQLVLNGRRDNKTVWRMLKFIAATQEALVEQYNLIGMRPPQRPLYPNYDDPWSFPVGFANIIRDIAEGNSVIRYDGNVGELWDKDEFLF